MSTVNHVERRPSFERTSLPGIVPSPFGPIAVMDPALPESFMFTRMVVTFSGMRSPSFARSSSAVKATGPQSWYGEIVSCGSSTETR